MKDERLGLVMIACSLLVILVISGLHLESQRESRSEQNRVQGLSLVRLLSSIPYERLVPDGGQQGPLQVVKTSQSNPDFAYALILDLRGKTLAEVTAPGVIAPPAPLPQDPSSWIGERALDLEDGAGEVREFFAPVLSAGERVAHVRVGFLDAGYAIGFEQASFFGMLALPIFLLTPLAYFLIRREVRPMAAACAELNSRMEGRSFDRVEIEATGEVGEFIHRFNRFMDIAEGRVRELQSHQAELVASTKVISYQKARIESALDTLPDATLVLDETGTGIFANAKLETIMGTPPESALGSKPAEWCLHPEVVAFLARYQGATSRLRRSDSIEFSPEGSQRTIGVSAHPLVAARDAPASSGTLAVFRDVSAAALAKRAQGEFVTHVAHELKSPLHVMSMYSEMLLGKEAESEEFRIEACNVMKDEIERLSMLVSTLLTIARIETGAVALDRQRLRLHEFLRDAFETVSRSGRKADLKFELNLPGDLSPVYLDKELFRVALNNLLTNAIKYNREGGLVTLTAEETPERMVIRVRDTGLGIHKTELRRIFEKFYRSEDEEAQKRGGHGLGLPLSKEVVELHGGEIEVESTPGEGSQFSISLKKTAALIKERVQS